MRLYEKSDSFSGCKTYLDDGGSDGLIYPGGRPGLSAPAMF